MNDEPEIVKSSEAKPIDGRSKAARAARAAAHPEQVTRQVKKAPIYSDEPPAAAARTAVRGEIRTRPDGRIEVTGRNGEVLARTRTQVGDIFDIPADLIPKGWSYQWNSISVAGNSEILLDQNHMMHQNGWRPVPAERYAGTLVPKGSKGNIVRGQQLLMERPKALTEEAQQEDIRNAKQLVSDRNESLKLAGVKKGLGEGFEMDGKYRGTGGGIRMQIDKSLDVVNINNDRSYQIEE
jgi:hypothetical protein